VDHRLSHLILLLNEKLRLSLSISFGVFLFILFFQPFTIDRFDFNNRLLFFAGFGGIVFSFMSLIEVILPWLIYKNNQNENETVFPAYVSRFIILALNSVAFTFYLRYVGFVNISFYIVAKVVLVCLAPPVALRLYDINKELRQLNESLIIEKKIIQKQIEKQQEDDLNKSIEFTSENNTEKFILPIVEIVCIKSADNYIEIVYKEDDIFKKRLIRNTLKNVDLQIKHYSNFVRCHRICIVNKYYIERLNHSYSKYWLTIRGFQEQIPVSRQYILKLKETL
jgi:DNA-binding LytR/AlgR family response regulator